MNQMYCKKHYINKGDHFRLVMFHHTLKLTNHPATIKTLEQRPRNQTSNALKKNTEHFSNSQATRISCHCGCQFLHRQATTLIWLFKKIQICI